MNSAPINIDFINVKKSLLLNKYECLASIDSGCSLTKVVSVSKEAVNQPGDMVTVSCALFANTDFINALEWLKSNADLPSNGVILVTGVGGVKHRHVIQEKLGLKANYVEEPLAQDAGLLFLINNVTDDELYFPQPEAPLMWIDKIKSSEMMQKLFESYRNKDSAPQQSAGAVKWPALIAMYGSSGGIMLFDKERNSQILSPMLPGGKPMLGLAKLLLGTGNYDEIMSLADKGDRRNVDTQVLEVLVDDENSPYGKFPPDMPIFSFGKASDHDKSIADYKKEDLAASLISMTAGGVASALINAIKRTNIYTVYFAGNLFRGEAMRKEMERMRKALCFRMKTEAIIFKYLKIGHIAAIGVLVDPEINSICLSN